MRVTEVLSPDGPLVVRADPRGVPTRTFLLGGFAHLVAHLRRRLRGDQAWTIHVRRRTDDPFGPDVYTIDVASKVEVPAEMQRVVTMARHGLPR